VLETNRPAAQRCYLRHRSAIRPHSIVVLTFSNELDGVGYVEQVMLGVIRFALVPGAFAMGDVVLRAYDSLRGADIKPFSFVCSDDPRMTLAPETHERAIAVLLAAGFVFSEA
jgi:hypothetical protein